VYFDVDGLGELGMYTEEGMYWVIGGGLNGMMHMEGTYTSARVLGVTGVF